MVRIHGDLPYGTRNSWSDGKIQRVEAVIDKILIGVYAAASAQTQKRIDDARRKREWEEREKRAEVARQLRRLEKQRQQHLDKLSIKYEEALRIQRFILAVEQNLEILSETDIQDMDIKSWLEWAKSYAEQIDPFMNQYWWDIEEQVPLWKIHESYY
jgi:hypothetical protein